MINYYKNYLEFLVSKSIIKSTLRSDRKKILGGHSAESVINYIGDVLTTNKPKTVLEIGTNKGFSLGFMKFISPESNVITLDIVKHSEVETYILPLISLPYARLIATSEDLPEILDTQTQLDFIYIDGSHSYENVKKDWISIQPYLHSKSVIVLDDLGYIADTDKEPGVTKLFNEISNKKVDCGEFGVVYND